MKYRWVLKIGTYGGDGRRRLLLTVCYVCLNIIELECIHCRPTCSSLNIAEAVADIGQLKATRQKEVLNSTKRRVSRDYVM
jgi:hypothetical protein